MKWAVVLASALLAVAGHAAEVSGRVVGVADGDTVTVLDTTKTQHKVRLQGIDAPEKAQAFGQRSKEYLSDQVFGRQVTVQYDKRDRYGRLVGTVFLAGVDVNVRQVTAGMAWHYKQYQQEQSPAARQAYAAAEEEARRAQRGLWRDADPVPPWEHRRSRR
jgi:endonuclease YncB( thermonuclease family)